MTALFLHCRAGFEPECAAEIAAQAADHGVSGHCEDTRGRGYVVFRPASPTAAPLLQETLPFDGLVFTRQWFIVSAYLPQLPAGDRIAPLVQTLASHVPGPAAGLFLETPDTNDGKALSPLCRALQRPFEAALASAGLLTRGGGRRRLHACFTGSTEAYAGWSDSANGAPWPMGVPRLKFPRGAPSRSTLKLEEALLCFLDEPQRDRLLRPGMSAVDLGAAPGGWTWQLVHRHLRVAAVDNGALAPSLLESGLVTHIRADGFRYRPPRAVDWMVCDIVEQPMRVAELAAYWAAEGWCRHAVFNLKLPMKRRYATVQQCLDHIKRRLATAGSWHVACKQLYHDREEVTVYLARR